MSRWIALAFALAACSPSAKPVAPSVSTDRPTEPVDPTVAALLARIDVRSERQFGESERALKELAAMGRGAHTAIDALFRILTQKTLPIEVGTTFDLDFLHRVAVVGALVAIARPEDTGPLAARMLAIVRGADIDLSFAPQQ